MDGTKLCSYEIEQEYRWVTGVVVVDANRLIALCRTDGDKKKYRICMLTWTNGKLLLAW
jgi:hypothetical protein